SSSLTQIGDVRQLDFLRAFDQVVEETAAHDQAAELLPKAIRTYCAVMAHHLESIERFEPAVARTLRAESAAALGRLPQDILRSTLSALGPDRAARLRRVRRHQA
ncbi:glycosyl transferase, partial [Streptomyces sp. NRRL F-6602]